MQSRNKPSIDTMIQTSFDGLLDIAPTLIDQATSRLAPQNISLVLQTLSLAYRTGELFLVAKKMGAIPNLIPNLNQSLFYALQAVKRAEENPGLKDDSHHYVWKVYSTAKDKLENIKRSKVKTYILESGDLLIDDSMLNVLPAAGSKKAAMTKGIHAKPGDVLTIDEIESRIDLLEQIGIVWMNKAVERKSAPCMNLRALILEMKQEEQPFAKRDYKDVYRLYYDASKIHCPTSGYSAFKAGQLLAEKKAGLDRDGKGCLFDQADLEKTAIQAQTLIETASLSPQYRQKTPLYRGMLKWNYRLYDGKILSEEKAVTEAYQDFVLAYKGWKAVPVIIALMEAGLSLYSFHPEKADEIRAILEEAIEHFCSGIFDQYKKWVTGDRISDNWAPSTMVFVDVCDQIIAITEKNTDTIQMLGLHVPFEKMVQHVIRYKAEIITWEKSHKN